MFFVTAAKSQQDSDNTQLANTGCKPNQSMPMEAIWGFFGRHICCLCSLPETAILSPVLDGFGMKTKILNQRTILKDPQSSNISYIHQEPFQWTKATVEEATFCRYFLPGGLFNHVLNILQ